MKSVTELLTDLVKVPSASLVDNAPVIQVISDLFKDYETSIQDWRREDGVEGKNLIVKIPGENTEKSLVFVCHMDTVPTSSEWTTDPYTLTEKDGKLYGLGSCDTKGGTAALIHAVLALEAKPKVDTFLVFSGDEEVSSVGALLLKETTTFKNPEFVFIEPTDRKVLISQRTVLQIDVTTHGLSQHGSYATPEENEKNNAIFKMAKVMELLIADALENAKDNDALLGSNTQNFGQIIGGTARNVMADTCMLSVDRRLLPSIDPNEEVQKIRALLKAEDTQTEVKMIIRHPSFVTAQDALLVLSALQAMKEQGINGEVGGFQAWSEAGLFADVGDVIILGPGSISQAHKANEYVDKKELEDYSPIFKSLMLQKV